MVKKGQKKGGGKPKARSYLTEESLVFLTQNSISWGVSQASDSAALKQGRLDLTNQKEVSNFLEWTLEKSLLIMPRSAFSDLPMVKLINVSNTAKFLLLSSKSKPHLAVESDKIQLKDLKQLFGQTEQTRIKAELSSGDRYDYWADFAGNDPIHPKALELLDSKGVKWKLIEHFSGEFPTVNADGNVKQFLQKQECEIAISK